MYYYWGLFCIKKKNSLLRYTAIETSHCFALPAFVILRLSQQYKLQFDMYFQAVSHNIENLIDSIANTLETQNSQAHAISDQVFEENITKCIKIIDYPENCFKDIIQRMKITKGITITALKERLIHMCMRNLCKDTFQQLNEEG